MAPGAPLRVAAGGGAPRLYQQQLAACDREIEAYLGRFAAKPGSETLPTRPRTTKPSRTAPTFDVRTHLYRLTGVDLTRIDGIDAHTALKVVAETGLDMSRWPTEKHFASWAEPRARHQGLWRQAAQ